MATRKDEKLEPGFHIGSWVRNTQFHHECYFHDMPYGRLTELGYKRQGYWYYDTIKDGEIINISRPAKDFILFDPDVNPIPEEDEVIWALHIMKG